MRTNGTKKTRIQINDVQLKDLNRLKEFYDCTHEQLLNILLETHFEFQNVVTHAHRIQKCVSNHEKRCKEHRMSFKPSYL